MAECSLHTQNLHRAFFSDKRRVGWSVRRCCCRVQISKFAPLVLGLQFRVGELPDPFNSATYYRNPRSGPGLNFATRRPEAACHLEGRNPAHACLIGLAESYRGWGRAFRAL